MRIATVLALVAASLPISLTALADEPAPTVPAEAPPYAPEPAPAYRLWRIDAGMRGGYVTDPGFDPYASNDFLPQLSIDATRTLFARRRFSLAAGLAWDIGGHSSSFRGVDAAVTMHRFTAPIEGRYHFAPWIYGFARVAPGAGLVYGSIHDPSAQGTLEDNAWVFATDVSAGASIRLGPRDGRVHFWITPEAGWGFTTEAKLGPKPARDDNDVLGSDASTRLPGLAMSGFFWRASIGVGF